MNALLRAMIRSMAAGGQSAPPTGDRTIAFNLSSSGNDSPADWAINLFNNTWDWWSPQYTDADGYPTNVPAGVDMSSAIYFFVPPDSRTQFLHTGNYVMKWEGGAFTGWAEGTGVSNVVQVGNRVTFTLSQVTDVPDHIQQDIASVLWQLRLHLRNDTGAPLSVTHGSLVCCHVDHEADWDAGHRINPDLFDPDLGCYQRAQYLRAMKTSAADQSNASTVANIPSKDVLFWPGWQGDSTPGSGRTGMPWEYLMEACHRAGCPEVFLNVPNKLDDEAQALVASRIYAAMDVGGGFFTGNIICETGNENWNAGAHFPDGQPVYAWLRDVYAPAHGLTGNSGGDATGVADIHCQARMVRALLNAGIPRNRIVFGIGLQVGSGFNGWANAAMEWVDTENLLGEGTTKKGGELIDAYWIGIYAWLNRLDGSDGSAQYIMYNVAANYDWKDHNAVTDEMIMGWFQNDINFQLFAANLQLPYMSTAAPQARRLTYEMGHSAWAGSGHGWGGTVALGHVDLATNTVVFDNADDAALNMHPSNGDRVRNEWNQLDSPNDFVITGINSNNNLFVRVVDSTHVRFYDTYAKAVATYADDAAAKAASMALDKANESTVYWFSNMTRMIEQGLRMIDFLDGPQGLALYQTMHSTFIGPDSTGKAETFCQYSDFGGYMLAESNRQQWGMKRGFYAPDTPRLAWFKTQ